MVFLLSIVTEHKVLKLDRKFIYYSKNYVAPGSRVFINFNNQNIVGFVLKTEKIESKEEKEKELGFKIKEITSLIDEKPILNNNLLKLAFFLKDRYIYPLIGVLNTMLPPSLRSEKSFVNKPKISYITFYELVDDTYEAKNKFEENLLNKFKNNNLVLKSEINDSKTLQNLINIGIIKEKIEEKYRFNAKKIFNYENEFTLNKEQNDVFEMISFSRENIYLLKGVTGSGKTLIYIKLVEDALKKGGSALILVPEVGLTPLMISHLLSYFNEPIAVLHSSLLPSERYDEYRKISSGEVRIVVGTRSAVFAPLTNLKYIIIDEEHDESYKQDFDLTYNAKDVAFYRNRIDGAKVVLGSATPSIETMAKAKSGKYKLLELNNKYFIQEKPEISLVDFKNKLVFKNGSSVFSDVLIEKIKKRIENNEQVILMINKRGYSSSLICDECGYVYKCPECNLPLIYHKENNSLMCHHCDYRLKFNHKCPICGSINIRFNGYGIEKVKEEFEKIFPLTPYLVLDSDTSPTLNQIEDILNKFNLKKVNVLIGTQIVAKGHDFKDVSLVGIINADTLLNIQSYKANEYTYSLLVQTIGRSGRFKKGEAVIQTYKKDNKVINFAINNDYDSFYNYEITRRKKYNYPPFSNIVSLIIASNQVYDLKIKTMEIKRELEKKLPNDIVTVSGAIERYKSYYSLLIFIKTRYYSSTKNLLSAVIFKYQTIKNLHLYLNISPYDL